MKKLVFALFILAGAAAWGQSASFMDRVLSQDQVRYGDSAYLVLAAAGLIPDTAAPEEAVAYLAKNGWVQRPSATGPTSLGQFSHLVMRAFGLKGGVMYSLFPGERYAARELVYKKIVTGVSEPGSLLSGEEVLRFLGRAAELQGGRS
ncbi:MAG TPA: hypothetical protein VMV90_08380 [Rectinemataceae bacterium]|nr:hypothetical protein [Rectinemataceae bacterium]